MCGGGGGSVDVLQVVEIVAIVAVAIVAPEIAPLIGTEMGLTGAAATAAGYATIGASESAIITAANGGNGDQIANAALIGGATGAIGGASAPLAGQLSESVGPEAASIIANAATGATKSVVSGGDPLAGAAGGAVGTGIVEAANAGDVGTSLSKAVGGAAGGATVASLTGKDPTASAALSFLTNLASGVYDSTKTPTTTTAGIDPSVPQYAQNVTVQGIQSDGSYSNLMGSPVPNTPPDEATLKDWLNSGLISSSDYDKGIQLAQSVAGQGDYITPSPQIIDPSILNTISKQSKSSGGGATPGNINTSATQSGFGVTPGSGKGVATPGSGSGAGGSGSGGGGGGSGDGGGGDSGYTPAPGISTIGNILGSQSVVGGNGGASSSLSSALLGGSPADNPANATGEPTLLSDGKRKDVWNLESLRGALGV